MRLIDRKAELDDESAIQEIRNDLCRCGCEDGDDGGLDPPKPCDPVRRRLDDDVLDDLEHACSPHGAGPAVVRTACLSSAEPTSALPSAKKVEQSNVRMTDQRTCRH